MIGESDFCTGRKRIYTGVIGRMNTRVAKGFYDRSHIPLLAPSAN